MDYYILNEDSRISNPLTFNDYTKDKANKDVVIYETITQKIKFIDYCKRKILFDSYHIISDKVKEVMEVFDSDLYFYAVFLTSSDMKHQYVYWEIDPKTMKAIEIKGVKSISDYKYKKQDLGEGAFFLIKFEKQEYILMREDLAESIMKVYPLNMKFKRVAIV